MVALGASARCQHQPNMQEFLLQKRKDRMELQVERVTATAYETSVLCDSPRVVLTVGAVSVNRTKAVIALAEPRLGGALVSGEDGGMRQHSGKG
jgi:hypothetical protein